MRACDHSFSRAISSSAVEAARSDAMRIPVMFPPSCQAPAEDSRIRKEEVPEAEHPVRTGDLRLGKARVAINDQTIFASPEVALRGRSGAVKDPGIDPALKRAGSRRDRSG